MNGRINCNWCLRVMLLILIEQIIHQLHLIKILKEIKEIKFDKGTKDFQPTNLRSY